MAARTTVAGIRPRAWKWIKKELSNKKKGCVEQLLTTTTGQTTFPQGRAGCIKTQAKIRASSSPMASGQGCG